MRDDTSHCVRHSWQHDVNDADSTWCAHDRGQHAARGGGGVCECRRVLSALCVVCMHELNMVIVLFVWRKARRDMLCRNDR
jgi:hypothetical protein